MSGRYLDELAAAAAASARAEEDFRRHTEHRLKEMASARVRAYRRYHLVNDMVERARAIPDKSASIAAETSCALIQAGWLENDSAFEELRKRLTPVAELVYDDLHGEPHTNVSASSILTALAAFEAWYRERFGTEFPFAEVRDQNTFQSLVDF